MERALQERIIGAVVLVVFAVLVVPIFLDGPADDSEIISETVTLPGQNNQERKQQTIVLERDRSEPVPAPAAESTPPAATAISATAEGKVEQKPVQSATTTPAASLETNAAKAEKTERVPVAQTPVAASNDSATGMWAVQLGSFSSQENAERLAADLRKQGYAAFLSQRETGDGALQRVRVGPQKDRGAAEAVAAQLAKGGHKGQVVPHP
jgi:DedD protein